MRRLFVLIVTLFVSASISLPGQQSTRVAAEAANASFMAGVSDPASLTRAVEGRPSRAKGLLGEMLAVTGPRTAANTLVPYDEMWGELHTAGAQAQVMAALHADEAMRRTADALNRAASAMAADVPLRRDVYEALAG